MRRHQLPVAKFQDDLILLNTPDSLSAALIEVKRAWWDVEEAILDLPQFRWIKWLVPKIGKLMKDRTPANLMTNRKFAEENHHFLACCKRAKVEPTKREAGKFRRKVGKAWKEGQAK